MGGEGSGRKPDVMKMVEAQRAQVATIRGNNLEIPNYSGIKTQALKTDSTSLSVLSALSSGYVPYYNGSALANSPIYIASATTVGINTTSPEGNFHVHNASTTGTIILTGGNGSKLRISQGSTTANGTIDLGVATPAAGLFRSGSNDSFFYYDITTGSTVMNNVFGTTNSLLFKHQGTTILTINSTGYAIHTAPIRLKNYTVATLPAGTQGDTAYVTDALAPAFLTAIAGGGAVVTPVFYDGTNWVAM